MLLLCRCRSTAQPAHASNDTTVKATRLKRRDAPWPQPAQDGGRCLDAGRLDRHQLEAALKGGVALNRLLELVGTARNRQFAGGLRASEWVTEHTSALLLTLLVLKRATGQPGSRPAAAAARTCCIRGSAACRARAPASGSRCRPSSRTTPGWQTAPVEGGRHHDNIRVDACKTGMHGLPAKTGAPDAA